jgi:Coenzyme PQQ synthesis protein D (PqqD)
MTEAAVTETYIARGKAVAARALGGEMMIVSVTDSMVFALDEVATVIWKSADGVTSLERIVREKVCSEFDVSPETALVDAEEFCLQLAPSGILLTSDRPIHGGGAK